MQHGLELPNMCPGGNVQVLVQLACLAEEAGWDGVFLEDYIIHHAATDAPTFDPWVVLTAIALRTERVRLGTTITPLSRRRPWKLAREAVTLDHLSNGRLILGVGIGDRGDPGFAQVGEITDAKQRARMLDEALDVLVGLWSGQPFSYRGEHYQVRDVTFLPRPMQQPRIPIWVGGSWPHKGPVQRAARWDGIVPYKDTHGRGWQDMTPDDVQALKAEISSQRSASFEIMLCGRARGMDWEQESALLPSLAPPSTPTSCKSLQPT